MAVKKKRRKSKRLSKIEGVRQSLATLGNETGPKKLQEHLKDTYRITMSTAHISNYKSIILRSQATQGTAVPQWSTEPGQENPAHANGAAPSETPKPAAKRGRKPGRKPGAKPAQVPHSNGHQVGLSLEDINTVKGLMGRVEVTHLKGLIDVLSK